MFKKFISKILEIIKVLKESKSPDFNEENLPKKHDIINDPSTSVTGMPANLGSFGDLLFSEPTPYTQEIRLEKVPFKKELFDFRNIIDYTNDLGRIILFAEFRKANNETFYLGHNALLKFSKECHNDKGSYGDTKDEKNRFKVGVYKRLSDLFDGAAINNEEVENQKYNFLALHSGVVQISKRHKILKREGSI